MKISGVDRLVLDTSAYSRLRAGNTAVLDMVAAAGTVLMPVVVLGELEAGFKLGNRTRENREALEEFLAEPFVATRSITRAVTKLYGELFAQLRQAGTPIPTTISG